MYVCNLCSVCIYLRVRVCWQTLPHRLGRNGVVRECIVQLSIQVLCVVFLFFVADGAGVDAPRLRGAPRRARERTNGAHLFFFFPRVNL